ncbi:MAG: ABC transporter substrate-binding protein [Burkholderiaceae bacterium]|nr:ABC transporter substrate-binding protein [Burkholderiaceae bacterium]
MAVTISAIALPAQSLTVYTAGPGTLSRKLAAGFEKKTGIKVDLYQATTGKVMARIEAEQANPHADVLISASWDTARDLDKRGWLAPIQSANAAQVPAQLKSDDFVAQGVSALALVWNPRSGTPEPSDWRDLTKPAYRNLVTMPDPSLSGTSADLLAGLQAKFGDGAWKLFADLKANGLAVSGPNAEALNPVLQGAKAAVFGGVDYVAYAAAADGEKIKVIMPASGTVIAPRPMMILRSSKEQAQARAFIDYVLSEEGQRLVADAWLIPARMDIPGHRASLRDLHLLPQNDGDSQGPRTAILERFADIFGNR